MKKALLLFGMLVAMTGCSAPAKSLRPLLPAEEAISVPELSGTWEDDESRAKESGGAIWTFEEQKNHEYKLTVRDPENEEQYVLTVRVASLGSYLFVDAVLNDITIHGEKVDSEAFWLPIHYFGRIELKQDEIHVRLLGDDWLKAAVKENRTTLRYEKVEDEIFEIFLTATTKELQDFAIQFGWDEEAFSYNIDLWRRPPEKK
jgi:hypothetical protein